MGWRTIRWNWFIYIELNLTENRKENNRNYQRMTVDSHKYLSANAKNNGTKLIEKSKGDFSFLIQNPVN